MRPELHSYQRAARPSRRPGSGRQPARRVLALALLVLPMAVAAWAVIPQGVSGRVTDAGGHPVADATVAPTDPLRLGTQAAFTDSRGRYQVGGAVDVDHLTVNPQAQQRIVAGVRKPALIAVHAAGHAVVVGACRERLARVDATCERVVDPRRPSHPS